MRLAALALATAGLLAQPAAARSTPSAQTRDFIEAAAASDTFEMMEAYSALAESKDPQVLDFARRMIRDHGQTSRALAAAARQADLPPPVMQVGAGQAPFLAALQSARGAAFDRTYWRQQALAHRSALIVEQGYAATGDTPAVRQAAIAAVPIIRAHLAIAERMDTGTGS